MREKGELYKTLTPKILDYTVFNLYSVITTYDREYIEFVIDVVLLQELRIDIIFSVQIISKYIVPQPILNSV